MPRRDVRRLILISLFAHLLALGLFLLVSRLLPPAPLPKEPPSFGMVFEPSQDMVRGGKTPSKFTSTPRGEPSEDMKPTPTPPTPPPSASQAAPEVNPFPPEFMQPPEPPPPPQANAEPVPQSPPHPQQHRQRSAQSSNPFAHMQTLDFSPPSRPQRSAGNRNSRSINMEEGPVISGGQLHDAVTHVIGPGGPEDYMALLSEYIETHKYYPESAAAAGEQGLSAVRVTIMRDGSVRSVQLVESSGSRTLDVAWEGVFQSGRLPAFTDDMTQNELTLTLSLDYTLIYR
jgi:protein TonB